jgi:hypothetical protein
MNRDEAHEILDRVKNGLWQSDKSIQEALFVCGDLQLTGRALRETRNESCYVRSRTIYGDRAYEREFGAIQELGQRRQGED